MTRVTTREYGSIPGCAGIDEAPQRYRGPLPSAECKRFIAGLERMHDDWVTRRAVMTEED
jgi:hypothetical protein